MRGSRAPPLPSPTGVGELPGRVIMVGTLTTLGLAEVVLLGRVIVVGLSTTLGVAGVELLGRVIVVGLSTTLGLAGAALIGRVKLVGPPPSSELAEVGLVGLWVGLTPACCNSHAVPPPDPSLLPIGSLVQKNSSRE